MMVDAVADSDFPTGIVPEPDVDALILSNHAVESHQASAFEASLVAEPASVAGLVPCAVGADLAAGVDIALGAATRFVPGSANTSDCIGVPVAGVAFAMAVVPPVDPGFQTAAENPRMTNNAIVEEMYILFASRYPTSPSMGSVLYEITCSIARSLARSIGWLSAVDRGGEKVDKGGQKVAPDEKTF